MMRKSDTERVTVNGVLLYFALFAALVGATIVLANYINYLASN